MGDQEPLEVRIQKWLAREGYPLEMKVAQKIANSAELKVRHGWHYQDPESNTSREIDIICGATEPYGFAEINFVIECKGTSKPWILFSSEDAVAGYSRMAAFGLLSKEARSELGGKLFLPDGQFEAAKGIPWFWKEGRVGYSIRQAFEGNNDTPYAGVLSAVKAALWLRSNSVWQSTKYRKFCMSFPAVVTSSPLYECYLDGGGGICLNRIRSGFLFFGQYVGNFVGTCVSIISEDGLDTFVTDCQVVTAKLMQVLSPAIEEEWKRFRGEHGPEGS